MYKVIHLLGYPTVRVSSWTRLITVALPLFCWWITGRYLFLSVLIMAGATVDTISDIFYRLLLNFEKHLTKRYGGASSIFKITGKKKAVKPILPTHSGALAAATSVVSVDTSSVKEESRSPPSDMLLQSVGLVSREKTTPETMNKEVP